MQNVFCNLSKENLVLQHHFHCVSNLELEKNNHFRSCSSKGKLGVRVEDGQPPKVKVTFGSSTAFMGEVEKTKGKEMTQGCEPLANRPGGTWERSHCSKLLSRKITYPVPHQLAHPFSLQFWNSIAATQCKRKTKAKTEMGITVKGE